MKLLICFLSYKAEVENQLNKKIERVRSDRGGKFILINDFCEGKKKE